MGTPSDTLEPSASMGVPEIGLIVQQSHEDRVEEALDNTRAQRYSIYSKKEKWFIVAMVALIGLYSPLPANIYFPSIPTLSRKFGETIEIINQSVTVYLAFQGVSPMLWGPLSDRYGRRPIFLVCLVILIGSSIGLALCPIDAYWLLLVFRSLQAGGCSSMIALGMGVCGDISVPEERGGFVGVFNMGPQLAPSVGPAIGGALAQRFGWRSIGWFIVIVAAPGVLFVFCFLPETLRAIAGNGAVPMTGIHRAVLPAVGNKERKNNPVPRPPRASVSINPFPIFAYPDITISLVSAGVIFAVYSTITSTVSSAYSEAYPWLSETILGVAYLPTGVGMLIGSMLFGRVLDWDYRRIKKKVGEEKVRSGEFPKEYARLRLMPAHVVIFVIASMGWGWAIQTRVSMAVPLVMQSLLGWTCASILNTTMTLNVDVLQERSSAATACTNLVRCTLAAVLVSVINRVTGRLGYGWTYVLLGGVCLLQIPLMYIVMRRGPKWRRKRAEDDEKA